MRGSFRGGFSVGGGWWKLRLVIPMATSPLLSPPRYPEKKNKVNDTTNANFKSPAAAFEIINYIGLIALNRCHVQRAACRRYRTDSI